MKKIILFGLATFIISGCSTSIKPDKMNEYLVITPPKSLEPNQKYPVIIYFQGSGGRNSRAYSWSSWFSEYGIGSVVINSAGVRGLDSLNGKEYSRDIIPTLSIIKEHPEIDLTRYAIMGFSRGGTAALKAGAYIKDTPKPDFIFSLYPGDSSGCPNSHIDKTQVHVFYGDLDKWGNHKGIRNSCEQMARRNDNTEFHLFEGVHHGYDGYTSGTYGKYIYMQPSPSALIDTKDIILESITEKWGLETIPK